MSPHLPETFGVSLPGDRVVTKGIGTGPASLASTRWACYRAGNESENSSARSTMFSAGLYGPPSPGPNEFIVGVEFGPGGEVERFFDNAFYFPEILGETLVPDGRVRPNAFPGMSYAAGSFGDSLDDEFGFAAPLNLWLGGVKVGTGVVYAYGWVEGDRLEGTFGYVTQILAPSSPFGFGGSDEYGFYAIREE